LRYWYTRDGDWRPGGTIFSRQDGLGSRQWAGSTVHDPESGEVTFFYTAVGDPDAPSLEEDPPPGPVSIFNEAIGRPSTVQRLAAATATVAVTDDGLAFENVGDHRIIGEADGFWYDTYETYLASEAVYGFRDPEYWRNPVSGEEHILFTGNAGGVAGPYNGAVGLMTRGEDGEWDLEPPILISTGVNSQLERPHVVIREDGLYLFFSTHDFTFSPEVAGPRGLYGFRAPSGDIRGRLLPLNKHGLVAANPRSAPEQVYSFLVLPDGQVMSYLNILWGFDNRPEYSDIEMYGGPAPMFRIRLDGDTATVAADADADR
jgi:levansucrase